MMEDWVIEQGDKLIIEKLDRRIDDFVRGTDQVGRDLGPIPLPLSMMKEPQAWR
jgi:hypothetical protein